MTMSGKFRDVMRIGSEVIEDRGWRSNAINEDFGRFLAAVLKKDNGITGWVLYIAIGKTTNPDISERTATFKNNIGSFFADPTKPYEDGSRNWAWAKEITPDMMEYLTSDGDSSNSITNKLKIDVKFGSNEPSSSTWELTEFSLLTKVETGIYLINYAMHGTISKSSSMTHERTIILSFPLNGL